MTDDQLREFITFCALGSLLEEQGVDGESLLTADEMERIQTMADAKAATLTEDEASSLEIETLKTLLRESIDRLLAVETATSIEPEETE